MTPAGGGAPIPERELAARSGLREIPAGSPAHESLRRADWWDAEDPAATYIQLGARLHDEVVGRLPGDFSFEGARVLDFGCSAGRVIRHFAPEAERAEVWGSDIDPEAIAWAEANLSPPFRFVAHGPEPPLPFPDRHFDLIYALSVFTHISEHWSAWLLEMRRLLKPDGLLFASYLGPAMYRWEEIGPWAEERTGMNVLGAWLPLEQGGPHVFHSEWWLRAHWGRAFEILDLGRDGLAFPQGEGHGWVLLRPKPVPLEIDELERDEPGEPRERAARRENLRQLRLEGRELAIAVEEREGMRGSLSWKATAPLRRLKRLGRGSG